MMQFLRRLHQFIKKMQTIVEKQGGHIEEHDFFISYKWTTYRDESRRMASIVTSRSYSAWVDWENPPAEGRSDEALATHLQTALQSCRYIIFFETSTTMAAQVGGPSVRIPSWQEYELSQAEASKLIVLYHSQDPPRLSFGRNRVLCPYHSLEDAMDQIVEAVERYPEYFKEAPCGDGGGGETKLLSDLLSQHIKEHNTKQYRSHEGGATGSD